MKAIVNVPICALYEKATRESTVVDEAQYGMVVEILEEVIPGWLRIRTHYRFGKPHCHRLLSDKCNGIHS